MYMYLPKALTCVVTRYGLSKLACLYVDLIDLSCTVDGVNSHVDLMMLADLGGEETIQSLSRSFESLLFFLLLFACFFPSP